MIWFKILIISVVVTIPPTNRKDESSGLYLCKGINSTYTQDTIRMYTNMKFHKGDSVEVGIPLKRK
jgi:hypothetical protein